MRQQLAVADVAELVQLSEYTIRQAIRAGELPASKLRGRIRIDPDAVAAWVEQNRVETPGRATRRPPAGARVPLHRRDQDVPAGGYRELAKQRRASAQPKRKDGPSR